MAMLTNREYVVAMTVGTSGFEAQNEFDSIPKVMISVNLGRVTSHPQNQCRIHQVDPNLMVNEAYIVGELPNTEMFVRWTQLGSGRSSFGPKRYASIVWMAAMFCMWGILTVRIQNIRQTYRTHRLGCLMYQFMLLGRLQIPYFQGPNKFPSYSFGGPSI